MIYYIYIYIYIHTHTHQVTCMLETMVPYAAWRSSISCSLRDRLLGYVIECVENASIICIFVCVGICVYVLEYAFWRGPTAYGSAPSRIYYVCMYASMYECMDV